MCGGQIRLAYNKGYSYYLYVKYRFLVLLGIEKLDRSQFDGQPLPSAPLRFRVHGSIRPDGFLRVGRACAGDIRRILKKNGSDFDTIGSVLDFGCGCGRVLRFLKPPAAGPTFYGTDIDEEAILWSKKHFPTVQWAVNGPLPPLRYPDKFFDFAFALSVFTHLDENYQDAWLRELKRVLKPNGLLLATVHGEKFVNRLNEEKAHLTQQAGILSDVGQTGAFKADGLPDFYQTTYHNRQYIESHWSSHYDLLDYEPQGMNGDQDAILLRRRGD
jgi:SAM-dependent methyltransferase